MFPTNLRPPTSNENHPSAKHTRLDRSIGHADRRWLFEGIGLTAVIVVLAILFILINPRFGLHVRAVGGNREAARLAGVPVNRIEVMVYALTGLFTALGGLIMMARIDSTQATIGNAMEIHVISAVIIGGTSLFGGRGSVYGSVMGALLLSMMTNALIIAGVDCFWQLVVMGGIVLIAVAISNLREQRIPALAHIIWRKPPAAAATKPAGGPAQ